MKTLNFSELLTLQNAMDQVNEGNVCSTFMKKSRMLHQKLLLILSFIYQMVILTTTVMLKLNLPERRDEDDALPDTNKKLVSNKHIQTPIPSKCNISHLGNHIEISDGNSLNVNLKDSTSNVNMSTGFNQLPHQIICLEIQVKSQQLAQVDYDVPALINAKSNFMDDQRTKLCTHIGQTSEIRRLILKKLVQRRAKKSRKFRSCTPLCSIRNQEDFRQCDNPPPVTEDVRQLFVRKMWGPVLNPNLSLKTSDTLSKKSRKRWGPILDLNSVFFPSSPAISRGQVSLYKRKQWGPVADPTKVFYSKHRLF